MSEKMNPEVAAFAAGKPRETPRAPMSSRKPEGKTMAEQAQKASERGEETPSEEVIDFAAPPKDKI